MGTAEAIDQSIASVQYQIQAIQTQDSACDGYVEEIQVLIDDSFAKSKEAEALAIRTAAVAAQSGTQTLSRSPST